MDLHEALYTTRAMLAARAEGIGCTLTGMLQSFYADEVFAILVVPKDAGWLMHGAVTLGYPTGKWGVAARTPVHEVAARNGWQGDLGFTVPEPLWTALCADCLFLAPLRRNPAGAAVHARRHTTCCSSRCALAWTGAAFRGGGNALANGGPPQNDDLHGSVPDQSPVVLLLIDVINALDFPGNEEIAGRVGPMAARIAALKVRAKALGIPAVYVNDNFGRWRSDQRALIDHVLAAECPGRAMAEMLRPEGDDYFVLKPKHSAFFSTTLDTLLAYLGARTLILTGVAGNICVFFSANDAYMRDFGLVVPADCVASNTVAENDHALAQMRQILRADITPSSALDLEQIRGDARAARPSPYEQIEDAVSVAQGQRGEHG